VDDTCWRGGDVPAPAPALVATTFHTPPIRLLRASLHALPLPLLRAISSFLDMRVYMGIISMVRLLQPGGPVAERLNINQGTRGASCV